MEKIAADSAIAITETPAQIWNPIFRITFVALKKKGRVFYLFFCWHLNDVDTALGLYHVAGGSIDQATLQRIVKTVAKADLDDHIVDVVFTLFDDNGAGPQLNAVPYSIDHHLFSDDGRLSQREFISIMKARQMRGMERPKDLGASRLLGAVWKCAKDEVHGVHH